MIKLLPNGNNCSLGEIGIHDRLKICSRFFWGIGSSPIVSTFLKQKNHECYVKTTHKKMCCYRCFFCKQKESKQEKNAFLAQLDRAATF